MATILRAFVLLVICAPAWAAGLSGLTDREASGGLKQALVQGAGRAVDLLGQPGGFLDNKKVRIPLPDGLAQIEPVMRAMGRGRDFDRLETAMNRAAEAAVPEARALLTGAIEQMTIDDARRILTGGDDSVTRYFRSKTEERLTGLFLPTVREHTERLDLAVQYNRLAGQASSFGLVKPEDAQIESYVTRRALDGLYLMIAEEERAIRNNPLSAAGNLAKRVFGALGR